MLNKIAIGTLAGLLAGAVFGVGNAQASTIFDSKALAEAAGAPAYNGADILFQGGLTAVFTVGADTPINQIGMYVSVPTEQDVKFLIFKTGLGGGAASLLYSQTKHFAATPMQYIYSDPFSFVLSKDVMYDIGLISASGDVVYRYTVDRTWTQNSLSNNWGSHTAFFGAPVSGTYVQFEAFIQLNTMPVPPHPPAAVPEPASWALMIGGLALAGGALRARRVRAILA